MELANRAESCRVAVSNYAAQSRWPEVHRFAVQWLLITPNEPLAHYWVAVAALQRGDLVTAQRHAEAISDATPDMSLACFLWAEIFLAKRQFTAALEAIQRAIAIAPENAGFYVVLCRAYLNLRKYGSSLKAVEVAIALDPDNTDIQLLHGMVSRIASENWEPESAIQEVEYLKCVLAADPRNRLILARIGEIFAWELLDYKSAVDFLRQSLEVDPSNAKVRALFDASQRNLHAVYRVLNAPAQLLYKLRRPWDVLGPFNEVWQLIVAPLYAVVLVAILLGLVFNTFWTWLPAQLYAKLIFAESCLWHSRYEWQRRVYRVINGTHLFIRIVLWCAATLGIWMGQLYIVFWYAPLVFLGIPFGWFAAISQMDFRKQTLAVSRPPQQTVRCITRRSRR